MPIIYIKQKLHALIYFPYKLEYFIILYTHFIGIHFLESLSNYCYAIPKKTKNKKIYDKVLHLRPL